VSIHCDDEVVVCGLSGAISAPTEHGYFAADTRLLSGHQIRLGGERLVLLNGAEARPHSARFEYASRPLTGADGRQLPAHSLHLRVDRTVGPGVHEDYDLTNYGRDAAAVDLQVSIESDFADLFDVRNHRRVRRGAIHSSWEPGIGRLTTRYSNQDFERSLILQVAKAGSEAEYANGAIAFRVQLEPSCSWHCCLLWMPVIDREPRRVTRPCHQLLEADSGREQARRCWVEQATFYETASPSVTISVRQAIDDLAGLRLHHHDDVAARRPGGRRGRREHADPEADSWVPAAGVPWFVTLFGRDALTASFQTLAASPRFALGSLRALAALQADGYDDRRDMQPGKIEHEVRHGELAALRLIPHTPYYGGHEVTTLYVLVAALAWRWHGDSAELEAVRPTVERALAWIDTDGDSDGDGLQEYQTRSADGYYNQGWKDGEDSIVMSDGSPAKLPIALCEHQGLVVAAKRAWADTAEAAWNDRGLAARLRSEANRLAGALEDRFWWDAEGTYYLGLDGDKRPIDSVASNAGHLLWQQAVDPGRAALAARRLMADDMWSGWGIRTLSSRHIAYDPLSYQRGSVWPHDSAIAAAGFRRYGFDAAAAEVAAGIFDAVAMFASARPPELFAGFSRDPGAFPVQYLGANVPQAWSSGALLHLVAVLLGLDADATAGVLRVSPALPDWLPRVTVRHLRVGDASADFEVTRRAGGGHDLELLGVDGRLRVELA
jgi:glycogen debranching enzyme